MQSLLKNRIAWLCILVFPISSGALVVSLGAQEIGVPEARDLKARGARVDALLAEYDDSESPGCALGVMTESGLVFAKGYGMANLDHGLPNTAETVFRIGSVSKQFTAAVMTLLAREGAFSLADGIRVHFPELPAVYESVTVRHLLHHTSGVRDYLELMGMKGVGDEATYSEDEVVELLAKQKGLNFPPGTGYRYSNSGYLLLSRLVHRVTGHTLREEAERLLFGPLGMGRTHFHDDHREIVPQRASGYSSGPDGNFYIDQTTLDIVGDGGVFTNIEDLSLWMANFWSLEVGDEAWLDEMEGRGILVTGDTLDYALGLRHDVQRGLRTVGHGGAFVGYRAATLRYPTEGVAVMALCNYGGAEPSTIVQEVGEVWLEERMAPETEDPRDPGDAGRARPPRGADVPISSEVQSRLLGEYYSEELEAAYRILRKGEGLVLDVNGESTLPLVGRGPDTLAAGWLTLTYHVDRDSIDSFRVGSGRAGGVLFQRR